MISTRERLVNATHELFRRHGYNGTSLKAITAAADAPVGSLYHFFPGGKSDLAGAVVRETGVVYLQLFELIADAESSVAAGVEAFFVGAADTLEQTDFIDVCPIGTVAREVASVDDSLRSATSAVFESWAGALAARLVGAGVTDDEASQLAYSILCALEGAFVIARARRDGDILRRAGAHQAALVGLTLTNLPCA